MVTPIPPGVTVFVTSLQPGTQLPHATVGVPRMLELYVRLNSNEASLPWLTTVTGIVTDCPGVTKLVTALIIRGTAAWLSNARKSAFDTFDVTLFRVRLVG